MRHEDVWRAIDTLAAEKGLSPSGLARAAGLDPTAFNRSKRATRAGRLRWPSTESLSRILAATGATLETFSALVGGARAIGSLSQPGGLRQTAGLREAVRGLTASHRLTETAYTRLRADEPQRRPLADYAVRLDTGDFEPAWREGSVLIVSPTAAPREGDRVVLCEEPSRIIAGILARSTTDGVTLCGFDGRPSAVAAAMLLWMHRVDWVSC